MQFIGKSQMGAEALPAVFVGIAWLAGRLGENCACELLSAKTAGKAAPYNTGCT